MWLYTLTNQPKRVEKINSSVSLAEPTSGVWRPWWPVGAVLSQHATHLGRAARDSMLMSVQMLWPNSSQAHGPCSPDHQGGQVDGSVLQGGN